MAKMVRGKWVGVAMVAVGLAALLLSTACAPASTEEAKTVEVGAIAPLTGAAGAPSQNWLQGIQDYTRYFNDQKGIPGVSISCLWGDTLGQYAPFYTQYEKFVGRDIAVVFALETVPAMGLKERFAEDKVVVCMDATGVEKLIYSGSGWLYFSGATHAEQFSGVADYIKQNWREARPPRLSIMGMNMEWGQELIPESTKYAQSLGFEVLPPETIPVIVLDATTQLLRLKDRGADFVFIQGLAATVGPILKDAERLNLLDQMHFSGNSVSMPESGIQGTGPASEGFLMSFTTPWFDETEIPGIKLMLDNQMKYHGKLGWRDTAYINGWGEAASTCEAIRRAIENVGYENLDGPAVKEALDNMNDFDVYGLWSMTFKDRPDHRGNTKLAVYEVKGGKIVRVSDWREAPSLVPEGLVRE